MNEQDAIQVLQRYRLGESTPAEDQLVEAWYQHLLATGEWQWNEDEKAGLELLIKARLVRQIELEEIPVSASRVHFLRTAWFRYAAVVLLFMGAFTFLWISGRNDQKSLSDAGSLLKTDPVPGSNKAILTLADGTTIALDSASNGILARQGNAQVVKLAGGQVAYTAQGAQSTEVMMNTMTTPRGGQYQLTLPDGTKVWLNAASSISYPAAFGKERMVTITGEVYVEVAENKQKPFKVNVNNRSVVEVLGTHFNINSYTDEPSIKTTLLEGRVKLNEDESSVVLKPGYQAVSGNKESILVQQVADPEQTIAWKTGLFNFNDLDLRAVMRQLERWYDIHVQYQGAVDNAPFRGRIDRTVPLSEVLEILQKVGGVRFRLEGKTLVVL